MKGQQMKKNPGTCVKVPETMDECVCLAEAICEVAGMVDEVYEALREIPRDREGYIPPNRRTPQQNKAYREEVAAKRREAGRIAADAKWHRQQPSRKPRLPRSKNALVAMVKALVGDRQMFVAFRRVVSRIKRRGYIRPENRTPEQNAEIRRKVREHAKAIAKTPRRMTESHLKAIRQNIKKAYTVAKETFATAKPVTVDGETHSRSEWAAILGLTKTAMFNRFRKYPVEIALSRNFESDALAYRESHPEKFGGKGGRPRKIKKG